MDVEGTALLVTSPTVSTISSSDQNDPRYMDPESLYPPDSPITVKSVMRKIRNEEELTLKPTPRRVLPPRKPEFRIRPPYLMICISIIEVIYQQQQQQQPTYIVH